MPGGKEMSIIRSTVHFIVKWTPLMKIVRLFLRPFIHRRGIWRVAYRLPLVGKQKVPIPNGEELLLETDRTDDIYKVLFWKGFEGFEKETVDLFMDLSKGSKVIFDIGANTGYYSLIAAKVNPDSIIIGFEPLPAALSAFKRNVEINKINNIRIEPKAASNIEGKLTLYVPEGDIPTSSSLIKGFREVSRELEVEAVTLDKYCRRKKIEKVDLVKMDTESSEHLVLQGMERMMKEHHPLIICEVLGGEAMKWHQENLPRYGYNIYRYYSC